MLSTSRITKESKMHSRRFSYGSWAKDRMARLNTSLSINSTNLSKREWTTTVMLASLPKQILLKRFLKLIQVQLILIRKQSSCLLLTIGYQGIRRIVEQTSNREPQMSHLVKSSSGCVPINALKSSMRAKLPSTKKSTQTYSRVWSFKKIRRESVQ